MSHKVVTLVYSRRVGSAHRKAILAYMADRASDNGQGVFCSKGTIADETEIARSTVFKTIRDLVEEGVLIEAGHRPCKNGATVVYDLNLDAIRAYPEVKADKVDQSGSRTPTSPGAGPVRGVTSPGAGPHQSGSRTPTSPGAGPKPSLEPPLNKEAEDGGAHDDDPAQDETATIAEVIDLICHRLGLAKNGIKPRYWGSAEAAIIVGRWMNDLQLSQEDILKVAVANAETHGSPARGPMILTDHMRAYAGQKQAAPLTPIQPKLTPIEGGQDVQSPRSQRQAAASDTLRYQLDVAGRMRRPSSKDCF